MIEEKVIQLKKNLVEYAGLVEGMVRKAMKGLVEKNRQALLEVVEKDEPAANNYELEMDEACTNLIAQFQPNSKNLRLILMVSKMSTDLERMGDHAAGNAKIALMIGDEPPLKPLIDLPRMNDKVIDMLHRSLNTFISHDAEAARKIVPEDDEVDNLYDQVFRELLTFMIEDPRTITRATRLIWVGHNLERTGDRVTNICERVVFMVTGKMEELNVSTY